MSERIPDENKHNPDMETNNSNAFETILREDCYGNYQLFLFTLR